MQFMKKTRLKGHANNTSKLAVPVTNDNRICRMLCFYVSSHPGYHHKILQIRNLNKHGASQESFICLPTNRAHSILSNCRKTYHQIQVLFPSVLLLVPLRVSNKPELESDYTLPIIIRNAENIYDIKLSIFSTQIIQISLNLNSSSSTTLVQIAARIAFAVSSCEEAVHNFRPINYQKSNLRVIKNRNIRRDRTEILPSIVAAAPFDQPF